MLPHLKPQLHAAIKFKLCMRILIKIIYSNLLKDIESHTMQNLMTLEALQFGNVLRVILKKDHGLPNLTIVHLVSI